jgi:hypothetical protein
MDRRERALGALRFVVLVLGGRSVLGASMGRGLFVSSCVGGCKRSRTPDMDTMDTKEFSESLRTSAFSNPPKYCTERAESE